MKGRPAKASSWLLLLRSRRALVSVGIISVLVFIACFPQLFVEGDQPIGDIKLRLLPPQAGHLFGCDLYGQDVFTALVTGARLSLYIAGLTVILAMSIGTIAGLVSGFFRGIVDAIVMGMVDILMAFPGILLAMALTAVLGPQTHNIVIAIALTGWTGTARIVRAQVLSLVEREYVVAARALGAFPGRVLLKHLLPALLPVLVVKSSFTFASVLLIEASLSFLGLGVQSGLPSWGNLLDQGRSVLSEAPHLSIIPGALIFTIVFAFNLFGDAVRDALDPKMQ